MNNKLIILFNIFILLCNINNVNCLDVDNIEANDTIIQTNYGIVRGALSPAQNVRSWLGIPFAAPPVKDLRWQIPQRPSSWSGIRNATNFGASCPQYTSSFEISEDCLYLNIFAPRQDTFTRPLPVLFWIYGGAWTSGTTTLSIYNGTQLIADGNQIIVVTVNYRLGVIGFLGSKELQSVTQDGSTGNYGLQDQRFALQWVIQNIKAFGGDPNLITIDGESAGAGSVSNHLIMPKSRGLFQRAIIESGPIAYWIAEYLTIVQLKFNSLAAYTSCNESANVVTCLKNVSLTDLLIYQASTSQLDGWRPTIDGVEIPAEPKTLAAEGNVAKVPVMLGSCKNEGTVLVALPRNLTAEEYVTYIEDYYTPYGVAQQVLSLYPASNYSSPWTAMTALFTDSSFICPARQTARWMSANNPNQVFLYLFIHAIDYITKIDPSLGVFHGTDLTFVFNNPLSIGNITVTLQPDEKQLALTVGKFWTNFMYTGNPNGDGVPVWQAYKLGSDENLYINVTNSYDGSGLEDTVCDFWDTVNIICCT